MCCPAKLIGADLPEEMPELWSAIIPDYIKRYSACEKSNLSLEEINQIISSLQIIEVILPSLEKSLFELLFIYLKNISMLLSNPYKSVRHMASRCVTAFAARNLNKVNKSLF